MSGTYRVSDNRANVQCVRFEFIMLHISLAAETLWHVWGFAISNAYLTTFVVMGLLIGLSYLATRKMSLIPSTGQVIAESIVGGLYDFFSAIAGRHIAQFFPIVASLFLFILVANWVGLLPGVGTVGYFRAPETEATAELAVEPVVTEETHAPVVEDTHAQPGTTADEAVIPEATVTAEKTQAEGHGEKEFVPLLRGATADLNMTLALAIVSVLAMQYFGFRNLGSHYLSRFINFKDPIMFSVGLLELVSDVSKVISFAFRLFGNIFAGEVLLAVMAFLMPFIVPLPFLMMELFVGLIQALVFSMLSTAFFAVAVSHGEGEHA